MRKYCIRTDNPILGNSFSRLNREAEITFNYSQKGYIERILNKINRTGIYINVKYNGNAITLKKVNPIKINILRQK